MRWHKERTSTIKYDSEKP